VTQEEINEVVLFLKSQNTFTEKWPDSVRHLQTKEQAAIQRGAFLVDSYNCTGCHMVDDRGVDVDHDHVLDGGDIYRRLSQNEDDKFRAPPKLIREGAKVYPDWLFGFLKAPFKLRENYRVRMPTFQFTDQQAGDLVAYFAAKAGSGYPYIQKKKDDLSAQDSGTATRLFNEAQCLSCHNLGGDKPIDPKNVAPNLRLAGARLQYDWLFNWLKNPQEQAPGVGMPNFFAAVEDKPGEYETPLTDIANGDWRRQIELLRAFVINLGVDEGKSAPGPVAEAPKKKKTRVR
jgi:mono/diheme cytochrome c family protein